MNRYKTLACIFFSVLSSVSLSYSQPDNRIADSLIFSFRHMPDDSTKVKELAKASFKLASSNPTEAVKVARYIVDLSSRMNYETGKAIGYNELGYAFERHSVNDSAFRYFFLSKSIFSKLNDPLGESSALFNIGSLHEIMGLFDSAAFYLYRSLHIADSLNETNLKGKNHRVIGNMLSKQNRINEALQYYFSSLRLLKIKDDMPELIARVHENIALMYIKKEKFKEAESYFHQALTTYNVTENVRGLARVHLNMATMKLAQRQYQEALDYNLYGLNFYKKINHLNGIAESLVQLAETYRSMKGYNRAIDYALQTLDIVHKNMDRDIELAAYKILHSSYFEKGNYKEAYRYQNKATLLQDSLFNEKKESIITELRTKYATEKKENEIKLLNKDKELDLALIRRHELLRNSLIAGAIFALIIGFLLFNRYRISQRHKQEAERMRISHDLHDDIGSTLSSIRIMSTVAENNIAQSPELIRKIRENSQRMIESMSDIVWAVNPANDSMENMLVRMNLYAAQVMEPLNIRFKISRQAGIEKLRLPTEKRRDVYLIFKEALNNLSKYAQCTEANVLFSIHSRVLNMTIEDNGNGFDLNSITGQKLDGGNGLSNMKKRVEHLKGVLTIQSEPGKGTRIEVKFPIT